MVISPSRTQSITLHMNRRIVQFHFQNSDRRSGKKKMTHALVEISSDIVSSTNGRISYRDTSLCCQDRLKEDCHELLWEKVSELFIIRKNDPILEKRDPWLSREKDLYLGFCNFSLIFWLSHLIIVRLNLIFKSLRDHQIARKTWETSSRFNFLSSSERAGWISWIMRLLQKDWWLRHRPWQ